MGSLAPGADITPQFKQPANINTWLGFLHSEGHLWGSDLTGVGEGQLWAGLLGICVAPRSSGKSPGVLGTCLFMSFTNNSCLLVPAL